MPVVFDANFLVPLLDPEVKIDPTIRAKLTFLVQRLSKAGEKIIIPTPALSEVLIGAGEAAPQYLDVIGRSRYFRIVAFDLRAAVEAAAAHRDALQVGDKREGTDATWAKVKFDRQIVAIAKVEGASTIYSHDPHIAKFSGRDGIPVMTLDDLPAPPEDEQPSLFEETPGS